MLLTKTQKKEFEEVVKPLIKFLNEQGYPHTSVYVTTDRAEMLEGVTVATTSEFIKD